MASPWQATVTAPVNIACIKYWGKRDTKLILPTNSSLSVTLNQDELCTTTSAHCDPSFEKDRLWLNGKEEEIQPDSRLATCIKEMKELRKKIEEAWKEPDEASSWAVHICSHNNFPTAAGLASSASGFAALIQCLATLYRLPYTSTELSPIARQGSGSACRSLFGGFVEWNMGSDPTGADSISVQVATEDHWPDINAVICVVSDAKKGTASTAGMQQTVETSRLLEHRIQHVVPQRMEAIKKAIAAQDFESFARITMQDSNQFHAVCLDTDPPIFYLNDVSRTIITLVHEFNRVCTLQKKGVRAAYTFDAGPNAVIYCLRRNVKDIVNMILTYFPRAEGGEKFNDKYGVFYSRDKPGEVPLPAEFNQGVAKKFEPGAVKQIIHTKIGGGPRVLDTSESLLGRDGLPKAQ